MRWHTQARHGRAATTAVFATRSSRRSASATTSRRAGATRSARSASRTSSPFLPAAAPAPSSPTPAPTFLQTSASAAARRRRRHRLRRSSVVSSDGIGRDAVDLRCKNASQSSRVCFSRASLRQRRNKINVAALCSKDACSCMS